jgi:xanthine dehydrogenase YagR molybdenum-binding subunit
MAGVSFHWYAGTCAARISIDADSRAVVRTAATDIGTGTATIVTQLAAEHLGLPVRHVQVEIGDTALPFSPQSGGSGLAMSVTGAVLAAARDLVEAFARLVVNDERSPLFGCDRAELVAGDGGLHMRTDPERGESYAAVLARHDLPELGVESQHDPQAGVGDSGLAPSGAYAAHFAEVHVDEELGTIRVARLVSAVDAGRVLNPTTARSQIIGGAVMGLGMALLEDLTVDGAGRIADVPDHDVTFVGGPDPLNPGGVKGIGEVGTVGIAAAVANAVHHATGVRVRSLPITIDKLLTAVPRE